MANVVLNAGRAILTNRIKAGGTEPLQIGVGTAAGTSAVTDTTLFTESGATRVAGTSTQQTTTVTSDTYRVVGTYTAAGTITITNAGTFDNATVGSGNGFIKGDFTGIALNASDTLTLTFNVQFT